MWLIFQLTSLGSILKNNFMFLSVIYNSSLWTACFYSFWPIFFCLFYWLIWWALYKLKGSSGCHWCFKFPCSMPVIFWHSLWYAAIQKLFFCFFQFYIVKWTPFLLWLNTYFIQNWGHIIIIKCSAMDLTGHGRHNFPCDQISCYNVIWNDLTVLGLIDAYNLINPDPAIRYLCCFLFFLAIINLLSSYLT